MDPLTNEQLTQKLADLEARMNTMPAEVAGKFEKALDETFSQAVAETVLRNGHVVAEAIKPYAGALVRAGLAQTFKGIVMAPVHGVRSLFGRKAQQCEPEPAADAPMGAAAAPAL